MSRPIIATIHSNALQKNLAIARQAAPDSRIWSVIKANGYGHGIDRIWQYLTDTDGFAILSLEEAILLRERGWKKPILLLEGFFHRNELDLLDYYRLTTCIHSCWQIKAISTAKLKAPLDIYVKVNTGMYRLGFSPEQVKSIWKKLDKLDNVSEITLMSHFAEAERKNGIIEPMKQVERAAKGLNCSLSLSNSAATLWHPEAHFDWVRPGIILYGASPSGEWQDIASTGLKPAMTLTSVIIGIQYLNVGTGIGYGYHYYAAENLRIGIVCCGYADGYPRHAPTGTPVMVDGIRTKTLGVVSMDMLAVDLTPCPYATIGSKVELWGEQIKIDEVAHSAGTVSYELMCALSPRVTVEVQ